MKKEAMAALKELMAKTAYDFKNTMMEGNRYIGPVGSQVRNMKNPQLVQKWFITRAQT